MKKFVFKELVPGAPALMLVLVLAWAMSFTPSSTSQGAAPAFRLSPGQSQTVLPNGSVLLLGGGESGRASGTALIYDSRTGKLETLASGLLKPRAYHSAILLPEGRVALLGGVGPEGNTVTEAEVFDPSTGTFQQLTDPGLLRRSGHSTVVLTDGRVLICGGVDERGDPAATAEIWNPRNGEIAGLGAPFDRRDASAVLLGDGSALIRGGRTASGRPLQNGLLFRPETESFEVLGARDARLAAQPAGPLTVTASIPPSEAGSVALEGPIVVRFSRPTDVASINTETVVLQGPGGAVPARVVPSQDGMLAFLTPTQMLFPGSRYTLVVEGVTAASGDPVSPHAFGFDTLRILASQDSTATDSHSSPATTSAAKEREVGDAPEGAVAELEAPDEADEVFVPGARHRRGHWRTGRALPELARERLEHDARIGHRVKQRRARFLKAAHAEEEQGTGIAGYVLKLNDRPLRGTTVSVGAHSTRTDARGRFRLSGLSAGRHELVIDGTTAGRHGREFAQVVIGVDVKDGAVTELPHAVFLPRIRARDWVTLDSPTQAERVLTHPDVPGLEVRIPRGAVIRDRNGNVLTRIAFVPVPMDRAPYPTPANFPGYFLLHPGGAVVQGLDPSVSQGIRIVYPNLADDAPGARQQLWFYDARERGWFVYGTARVSADGRQIVPDPGAALYEAMGFSFNPFNLGGGQAAPAEGSPPEGCEGQGNPVAQDGDPVDCFTGLFLHQRTDLVLPDVMPIKVRRSYRPRDTVSRAFGVGSSHSFAMYLHGSMTTPNLVLPDGAKLRFDSIGSNVWRHTATPTEFQYSQLETISNGTTLGFPSNYAFKLTLKDKRVFYFSAGSPNNLIGVADRNGNRLVLSWTGGLVYRVTGPSGRYVDFTYDGSSRITQLRDISNRTWSYEYNGTGRLAKATYPDATFEEYTYNAGGSMETVKDRRGNIMVTNVYDANSRVQQQTLADSGVYQFAYTVDGSGKVTQTDITNPRGFVRRVAFNADGYPTSATWALGTALEQTYTYARQAGTNLLLSVTDPLSRETAYTYDSRNNVASVTRMANTTEAVTDTFVYDTTFNRLTSRTDALNKTTTLTYDAQGNLTQITDPLSNQVGFAYNAAGQPTSVTNGVSKTTQFAYDLGDLVEITDPLGRKLARSFDILGRLIAVTDPLGNRTEQEYDAVDRLKKVIDAYGETTQFAYDGNGNLTGFTDAAGGVHQYAYDPRDRRSGYTDPLAKTESYAYDGMGNLTGFTDRKLQASAFAYDALDRRTLATFADASTIAYTYDGASRLTQALDSVTGAVTRAYDSLDRMTSEITPHGTVTYAYDAGGRRTAMTVNAQPQMSYAYDDAHRLASITQGSAVVQFAHDAANRRTGLTLPSGIVAAYGYDDASQLTGIAYTLGSNPVGDLVYAYDLAGRRTDVTGSLARTGLPAAVGTTAHDAANRVTDWNGATVTYDDNGNMLSDGARSFTWDARNRLVAISGAASASFAYDAVGRRISKTVGGGTTDFVYDGLNPVQERSSGGVVANLITGLGIDEFIRRTDASGDRDFVTDALGSTLALADGSGAVQTSYTYDPYGNAQLTGAASSNSYQYTGRENDGTGLYHYRLRYYYSTIGRFLSEDPIGPWDGGNTYLYALGAPTAYTDPLGLWSVGLEGYFGLGGGVIVHATGNPFVEKACITGITIRFGKGIGIQGTWDPLGQRPGAGDPNAPMQGRSSLGFFGQAGIGALGVGVGANGGFGTGSKPVGSPGFPYTGYGYGDVTTPIGPSASPYGKWGFGYGVGGEATIH